jgi:hypothetical protein
VSGEQPPRIVVRPSDHAARRRSSARRTERFTPHGVTCIPAIFATSPSHRRGTEDAPSRRRCV